MFPVYTKSCKQLVLFQSGYKIFFIILELIFLYQLSSLFNDIKTAAASVNHSLAAAVFYMIEYKASKPPVHEGIVTEPYNLSIPLIFYTEWKGRDYPDRHPVKPALSEKDIHKTLKILIFQV